MRQQETAESGSCRAMGRDLGGMCVRFFDADDGETHVEIRFPAMAGGSTDAASARDVLRRRARPYDQVEYPREWSDYMSTKAVAR